MDSLKRRLLSLKLFLPLVLLLLAVPLTVFVIGKRQDLRQHAASSCQTLGGVLTSEPTAIVFNNQIHVYVKGSKESNYAVYAKHSSDGVNYTDWQQIGGVATTQPKIENYGSYITLQVGGRPWNGITSYWTKSTDGVNFTAPDPKCNNSIWCGGDPGGNFNNTVTFNGQTYQFSKAPDTTLQVCNITAPTVAPTMPPPPPLPTIAPTTPPPPPPTVVPTPPLPTPWSDPGPTIPQPTTPPPSAQTAIALSLALPGIGLKENNNPLHKTRQIKLQLFDANNNLQDTQVADSSFDPSSGFFKTTIYTNSPPGVYIVKVSIPQYLVKRLPGITTLTAGTTDTAPLTLSPGDLNGDNRIDILDFNLLLNCYSDTEKAKNCSSEEKQMADLNDDGKVHLTDLNLFMRNLQQKQGD